MGNLMCKVGGITCQLLKGTERKNRYIASLTSLKMDCWGKPMRTIFFANIEILVGYNTRIWEY